MRRCGCLRICERLSSILLAALILAACPGCGKEKAAQGDLSQDGAFNWTADEILERTGIVRGICVILGDATGALAIELARKSELLVYVQLESAGHVERVRGAVHAAGLYGTRIYVEWGEYKRVHLADNLADALVAVGEASGVSEAETLRVIRPQGKVLLGKRERIKPFPHGVDDWSHPYHGPDNNTQSNDRVARAPYLTQFLADPRYAPLCQVAVASAGRVFKAFGHVAFKAREEPWLSKLVAFNGYNGTILWTRDLVPGIMVHRNTILATPETLLLGDDQSCKIINAVTGELKDEIRAPEEIAGGTFWKWMALEDGILYALVGEQEHRDPVERHRRTEHGWPWDKISEGFNMPENPWGFGRTVLAFDLKTKEVLWSRREKDPIDSRALCMKGGRIYLFRPGSFLLCLNAKTGAEIWRKSAPKDEAAYLPRTSSTLSVRIESIDKETGKVVLNGTDTQCPQRPFTWNWGDGTVTEGFFPQEHVYGDLKGSYVAEVTAHYPEGGRDVQRISIRFQEGSVRYSRENAPELFEGLGPYLNRQGWNTNWRTAAYLKCSDKALYFAGPQVGKLVAVSAEDGGVLWENPYDNFQLVLRDDGLYAISGPWGTNVSKKFDPLTGEVLADLQVGRRACARPNGSVDAIFFRAAGGSVRLDAATGRPQWISPMRAQCHDGVTVANGLLYWWPSVCDCNLTLNGVTCLGPAGDFDFYPKARESERLERGEGNWTQAAGLAVSPKDWPAFRGNPTCTALSEAQVPQECRPLWVYCPPYACTPTAPTAAGGLVFFSGSHGIVRALDGATGKEIWSAFTGGSVRFPPAIGNGRALVGSGDGWVYCFDARTGRLLWRFRAAPEERKIPVYGGLLSTWSVASGVLLEQGIAYFAAGIANYDGTYVFALDAATGRIKWQNNTSGHLDREARTGVCVQGHLLLHGGKLFLAGGTAVSPAVYDAANGKCLNPGDPLQRCEARGSRGWELYRIGDKVVACGRPFYAHPEHPVVDADVSSKMLVSSTGERDIVWLDNRELLCFPPIETESLNRCVAEREKQDWFSYTWGEFQVPDLETFWTHGFDEGVALAVCRNGVIVAGKKEIKALDLLDGKTLWSHPLPSPPVPWGLAVDREGRTVVTLEEGKVLCFGSAE